MAKDAGGMSIDKRAPYYFIAPIDVRNPRRADRERGYREVTDSGLKKWSLEEAATGQLIAMAEGLGEEFLVWKFSYIKCRNFTDESLVSPSPEEWLDRAEKAGQNGEFQEVLRCVRRSRLSGVDWSDWDRHQADVIQVTALLCLGDEHTEQALEVLASMVVPKDRIGRVKHFLFMSWVHAALGQEAELQEVMKSILGSWTVINASLEWPETALDDPRGYFTSEEVFAPYRTKPWFVKLLAP